MKHIHKRKNAALPLGASNFLAAFEGIEGGFAIAAGIIAGMTFAGFDKIILISVGVISIVVQGFNSACMKYSTEHYLDELDGREKKNKFKYYLVPAILHFLAYALFSMITFVPLLVIHDTPLAIFTTCLFVLVILLIVGSWRASLLRMPRWRDGFELLAIGASIIAIGYASGWVIHIFITP